MVIPSTYGDREWCLPRFAAVRKEHPLVQRVACVPAYCPSFQWLRAKVPRRSLALLIVAAATGVAGMDERLLSTRSAASHILGQHLQHRDLDAGARSSLTSDPMGIQAARGLMLAETLGSSSSKGSVVPMG